MIHDRTRSGDLRLPVAFHVTFQIGGRESRGVAVNVSPEGLCLHSDRAVKEGQVLTLLLSAPEYGEVEVQGQVRWVQEMSPLLQPTWPWEAGLRIEEPSDAFQALFRQQQVQFVEYRDTPRIPHLLRVMLSGPGTWETTFALNIGRRGLFVRTEQPLDPGALVEVRLHVPGLGDAVPIRAEVVYRLAREEAREVGAEPGVGLRLGTLPSWARQSYQDFVSSLEERYAV